MYIYRNEIDLICILVAAKNSHLNYQILANFEIEFKGIIFQVEISYRLKTAVWLKIAASILAIFSGYLGHFLK